MLGITPAIITAALGVSLPVACIGLMGLAAAVYIYVPVIGRFLGVSLLTLSLLTLAFDEGYKERGSLDQSATLQTQIAVLKANAAEAQRQANASSKIAETANAAELAAESSAATNQSKVEAYEAELAKRQAPGCDLSDADVVRLHGIGAASRRSDPPQPPARPFDVRPVGNSSEAVSGD